MITEGWSGADYYTFFDVDDHLLMTSEYGVDRLLPGYTVVGLIGWDDFLLCLDNKYFTCPTVPIQIQHVTRLSLRQLPTVLSSDDRLAGQCKWYITPLVFGGDPKDDSNICWVDYKHHRELVRWWNAKYKELKT
jgi:hypothetical protein